MSRRWLPMRSASRAKARRRCSSAVDGQPAGIVAVADTLKETSARAVAELKRLGLDVVMITGDNRRTAEAIAAQLGIDRVLAEVLPQAKAAEVRRLQEEGKRVAMVGDGVNDAPALAQADVGMAIGSGTDVAKETGDVILIRDDVLDVAAAVQVARATMRLVRQNLFWAFGYNAAAIPLAAGVLYPFFSQIVSPELAALLMATSSFSVTMNTLRMRGYKPPVKRGPPPATRERAQPRGAHGRGGAIMSAGALAAAIYTGLSLLAGLAFFLATLIRRLRLGRPDRRRGLGLRAVHDHPHAHDYPLGPRANEPVGAQACLALESRRRDMHHKTADAPHTAGRVIHWARYYDLFGRLISFGRDKAIRQKVVQLASPSPGENVLDVGCGTGTLAIAINPRVGEGEVHGIDASPEMIEVAKEKAAKAGAEIDFQVALIEAIPFPDASFDLVTSSLMLHHLPDDLKRKGFAEIRRVLKPGGRFLAMDFAAHSHSPCRSPALGLRPLPRRDRSSTCSRPC